MTPSQLKKMTLSRQTAPYEPPENSVLNVYTNNRSLALRQFPETAIQFHKHKGIPKEIKNRMRNMFRYYIRIYDKGYGSRSRSARANVERIIRLEILAWSFMKFKEHEILQLMGSSAREMEETGEDDLDLILLAIIFAFISHVHTSYQPSEGESIDYETDSGVFLQRYFKKFRPTVHIGDDSWNRTLEFRELLRKLDSLVLLFLNSGMVGYFTGHGGSKIKKPRNTTKKIKQPNNQKPK
jgi:hypothetical protein